MRYFSMIIARVFLVHGAFTAAAKAATIAARWSCVRRQGFRGADAAAGENALVDYTAQRYRVLRVVSLAYTLFWNARVVQQQMMRARGALTGGDAVAAARAAGDLQELHASVSGMKAWGTTWAHAAVEDLRKSCGGQGYLMSSGIAGLSATYTEYVTVEGDPVVLSKQVARHLIRSLGEAAKGVKLLGDVRHLGDQPHPSLAAGELPVGSAGIPQLVALLRDRAARTARSLAAAFAGQREPRGFDAALDAVALEACKAAECHTSYIMARNAAAAVRQMKDPATQQVLLRLCELGVLVELREHAGDWLGVLGPSHPPLVLRRIGELLQLLRPDIIALTDAFGFADHELGSAIGRHDGRAYEAIVATARTSPLNKTHRMVGWDDLATVVDLDLLRTGMRTQRQGKL